MKVDLRQRAKMVTVRSGDSDRENDEWLFKFSHIEGQHDLSATLGSGAAFHII